jgi:predicted MFS family arabinose efflux permease
MTSRPNAGALSTPAKLGLLGSLYFTQGLPFGFFTQALPIMLRKRGSSLGEIGLSSLLALPWALKFLWAPAIDRCSLRGVGPRKSWIVPLQAASAVLLLAVAAAGNAPSPSALMSAVLLLNLVAATQDVATDGLAVDLLAPSERGVANGLQVAGYRVGMIAGGGVLLVLFDRGGSTATFLAMAALTVLASLPVVLTREERPRRRETGAGALPHFLRRPGALRLVLLLVTYKAGDAFATAMLRPFLVDLGLGVSDVGWLLGTVGFSAGLAGAMAGGALLNLLGRRLALVGFGALQAAAVVGYAGLAMGTPTLPALYAVCGVEHFTGGMATAALFTSMMDWSSPQAAATDYTVQASAVVIATGLASALAGFSAQAFGYAGHFFLAAAIAVGAPLLVALLFPRPVTTERASGAAETSPCA